MEFTRSRSEPVAARPEHPKIVAANGAFDRPEPMPTAGWPSAIDDLPDESKRSLKSILYAIDPSSVPVSLESYGEIASVLGKPGYENVVRQTAVIGEPSAPVAVNPGFVYEPGDELNVTFYKAKTSNRGISGCDIVPTMQLPGQGNYVFGDISTLSVSTHRESFPARICGRTNPLGFTRGPRTIAGTLIFSLLDVYPWYKAVFGADGKAFRDSGMYPLADSLPPFDITVSMHNEYEQHGAVLRIFGVVLIDDGVTLSIDDLVTEQTFSFMAAGIAPIHGVSSWVVKSDGSGVGGQPRPPWMNEGTKPRYGIA